MSKSAIRDGGERITGVLVVDKPQGPTSHDVVARVRRALGTRQVGHTGTLDPLATGVLPMVVGRATRLARFFAPAGKTYEALIRLGTATDTCDITGTSLPGFPRPVPAIDRPAIEAALERFHGTYPQVPPAFSAKKIGGVRAYALARADRAVAPAAVAVTVHRLSVLAVEEDRVRLAIDCAPGFYVRALARDLGEALGTGGCLAALRRTRSGEFGEEQAVPLEVVEREGRAAGARLVPPAALLPHLPALVLTEAGARRAAHGNTLTPAHLANPPAAAAAGATRLVRLIDARGTLLAIAEGAGGPVLHPLVVLV